MCGVLCEQEVKKVAYGEITANVFEHLLGLSLQWHLKKKIGQVRLLLLDSTHTPCVSLGVLIPDMHPPPAAAVLVGQVIRSMDR